MEKRDLTGMRILITDDNALYADMVCELLTMRHARVSCARSGEEALSRIAGGEAYDAVLMDVQMPGMDGYAATRAIRLQRHGETLPVFAMSASSQESDRVSAFLAGMNGFLQKPLEMATLDRALTCVCA